MNDELQKRVQNVRMICQRMIDQSESLPAGPWTVSGRFIFSGEVGNWERIADVRGRSSSFIASSRQSNPAAFKCVLEDLDAWVQIYKSSFNVLIFGTAKTRLLAICETMEALERV